MDWWGLDAISDGVCDEAGELGLVELKVGMLFTAGSVTFLLQMVTQA